MGTVRHMGCAFDGGRTGQGPATWGQRAIWDAIEALAPHDAARYTVRGDGAVLPGYTSAQIGEAVRLLMLRHESLRTRLAPAADGALRQRLIGAGELAVAVVECEPGAVRAEADVLLERIAVDPFAAAAEWPIRLGLIESEGTARHLVLAVAHTAVDGWGLRHLVLDLAELTEAVGAGTVAAGTATSPTGRLQPLDEALYQSSDRGRRQDAKSRRHWLGTAEKGPRDLLAPRDGAQAAAAFPNALLDSPALARALPLVAARLAASPATVLLAATAATIGSMGGAGEVLFQVVVNNRFQPGLERAVSTVAQEGLFHLDVPDVPFAELVRGAVGASLSAYRHAYYDKALLDRELGALRSGPDGCADLTCFVNDTRGLMPGAAAEVAAATAGARPDPTAGAGAPARLEELREHTELRWPVEFPPRPNVSFALDAVDLPGSLGLTMTADPVRLPRLEMQRLLFGIEELVVTEALAHP